MLGDNSCSYKASSSCSFSCESASRNLICCTDSPSSSTARNHQSFAARFHATSIDCVSAVALIKNGNTIDKVRQLTCKFGVNALNFVISGNRRVFSFKQTCRVWHRITPIACAEYRIAKYFARSQVDQILSPLKHRPPQRMPASSTHCLAARIETRQYQSVPSSQEFLTALATQRLNSACLVARLNCMKAVRIGLGLRFYQRSSKGI